MLIKSKTCTSVFEVQVIMSFALYRKHLTTEQIINYLFLVIIFEILASNNNSVSSNH